ncbi:hypothetical protein SADUNF_Sadunf13G0031300 [Salix dunnii]|uniref:Uncharacterized protein n=1 Tax=Salix dunnii TaxID=1413687 RepID=A0A835JG79_9ROSI|nr:hypothetical protein SADUNF_Sadunf13G0031300 [Salix dunnii]
MSLHLSHISNRGSSSSVGLETLPEMKQSLFFALSARRIARDQVVIRMNDQSSVLHHKYFCPGISKARSMNIRATQGRRGRKFF